MTKYVLLRTHFDQQLKMPDGILLVLFGWKHLTDANQIHAAAVKIEDPQRRVCLLVVREILSKPELSLWQPDHFDFVVWSTAEARVIRGGSFTDLLDRSSGAVLKAKLISLWGAEHPGFGGTTDTGPRRQD